MKTFTQHILAEKRSHAELNPKVSINEIIRDAVKNTKSKIAGVQNLFISMTSIDKLGINPNSSFNTPLGIYSYPAKYVYNETGDTSALKSALPFAGENQFVNIFSVKGNIVNLHTMSEASFNSYIKKIKSLPYIKTKLGNDSIDNAISMAEFESYNRTPGGKFWYITMIISDMLTTDRPPQPDSYQIKHANKIRLFSQPRPAVIAWNKLFRDIGIDGCIDPNDEGIIHTNEPTQAVFFSLKAIAKNDRYDNKYSPSTISKSLFGKALKFGMDKMTESEMITMLNDDPFRFLENIDIKTVSEKILIALIGVVGSTSLLNRIDPNQFTPKIKQAFIKRSPSNIKAMILRQELRNKLTSNDIDFAIKEFIKYKKNFVVSTVDFLNTIKLISKEKFLSLLFKYSSEVKMYYPEYFDKDGMIVDN